MSGRGPTFDTGSPCEIEKHWNESRRDPAREEYIMATKTERPLHWLGFLGFLGVLGFEFPPFFAFLPFFLFFLYLRQPHRR